MASKSFEKWQNERMPRLALIESQCTAVLPLLPHGPMLLDENLRGYVMALSAHFQGFCRDLYTEASQRLVATVSDPALASVFQVLFTSRSNLDRGNPNYRNIKEDFHNLGLSLDLDKADAANGPRLEHLTKLNAWRNIAAHQGTLTSMVSPLSLLLVTSWRSSCDELAMSMDDILYNYLSGILKSPPW